MLASTDGGKTWKGIGGRGVHGDYHAIYIDPKFPRRLAIGNDGGINVSYDYGETWTKLNNLPVGQFTILAVDSAEPYNIVGGLQDNGVMRGPSTYRPGKSDPAAWKSIYGGDGSCVAVDPKDPNTVYAALQFGIAARLNVKTGERASVRPRPELSAKKKEKPLRYNWITPNQFNDAHSALSGGFTYHGTHYTGDQAAVAQGDNFLSLVVPQIMASQAYHNNGAIILWWDEAEGGDTTSYTIPEIIISPLAKGNAYASSVVMSHSSDLKTMEEIFALPNVNNPIPAGETNNFGGHNNVAIVNDLSDLFVPGTIPAASLSVSPGDLVFDPHTQHYSQLVRVINNGDGPAPTPVRLVLDNLSANATLLNADGTTEVLAPLGSPYIDIDRANSTFGPHETRTVQLEFADPGGQSISYDTRVLSVVPTP